MNTDLNIKFSKDAMYKYIKALCHISGFATLAFLLYYIIYISKGFYHSDCSDTILWAQAMIDGKTIMNPDFKYAALLPFGGQLIMAPFVAIFGYGMKAQIIGMSIFALLFAFAVVYFCKAADLSYKWSSLTLTFVLLFLCSSEKLREIFWSHIIYYSLGAFFLLLGLGLVLNIIKRETFSLKHYILLFIWTTLCSINGSQSLTLYTIPVIGALVAERFFDLDTPFFDKKNGRQWQVVINLIVSIIIGYFLSKIINQGIVADYQEAYSTFDANNNWIRNMSKLLPSILSLCGVESVDNVELFSSDGITTLLTIICVLIVMIVPFIMAVMYKKFTSKAYRITILTHLILTALILTGWIFGLLHAANWRLSPLLVTSSILTIMFVKWIIEEKVYLRLSALLIIPVIILTNNFSSALLETCMVKEKESTVKLETLGNYLQYEGLEYGYATFWNSNVITLLTNSKVQVIGLRELNKELVPAEYQTNVNWYNDDSHSEYFLALTRSEYYTYKDSKNYKEPMETIEFMGYFILVYDYNIMSSNK